MFRTAWLEHVGKVRKRENRGKKECSYREAMKIASTSWAVEKKKLERRLKKAGTEKSSPEAGKPPKSRPISLLQKSAERSAESDKAAT